MLIVTLVNSAVDNFAARIKEFLALPMPFGYRVRTLHGLAHDIVREKPAAVGLEDRFAILDEREADFIRKEAAAAWLQAHPDDLDDFLDPDLDESKRDWVHRQQLPDLVTGIALAFIRSAKDNRLTPEKLRRPAGLPRRLRCRWPRWAGHLHRLPARPGLSRRGGFRRPDPPGDRPARE